MLPPASNPFREFPDLLARLAAHDEAVESWRRRHEECRHGNCRLFVVRASNGVAHYRNECLDCGRCSLAIAYKKISVANRRIAQANGDKVGRTPFRDRENYHRAAAHAIRWTNGFYALYLGSAEWSAKRLKALALIPDLPSTVVSRLADRGIYTVGDLAAFTNGGGKLTDVKGVSETLAEKALAALDAFWKQRGDAA